MDYFVKFCFMVIWLFLIWRKCIWHAKLHVF